jgi:hypothetical protein
LVERNLNSIARTPIVHQKDLLEHTHVPRLRRYDICFSQIDTHSGLRYFSVIYCDTIIRSASPDSPWKKRKASEIEPPSPLIVDVDRQTPHGDNTWEYWGVDESTGQPMSCSGDDEVESSGYEYIDPETGESISPQKRTKTGHTYTESLSSNARDDNWEYIPAEINESVTSIGSSALKSLCDAYVNMDIRQDPAVIQLILSNEKTKAEELISSRSTCSREKIRLFICSAKHLQSEYGPWAADWYIAQVIDNLLNFDALNEDQHGFTSDYTDLGWVDSEHKYVWSVLSKVSINRDMKNIDKRLTDKAEKLIEVLVEEYQSERHQFSGLVFVEQRVGVPALVEIISRHPKTSKLFKIGQLMGKSCGKKKYRFLMDTNSKQQNTTLSNFKTGEKNLIVATSVVEEGLDIQDCHLVVCFDPRPV